MASLSFLTMWKRSRMCRAAGVHRADHVEIGLPHVRAHEAIWPRELGPDLLEEALEGLLGAVAPDPQQALAVAIDLVNQRPKLLLSSHVNLVDPEGEWRATASDSSYRPARSTWTATRLGALSTDARERLHRVACVEWGESLIESWNAHDWISAPERVGAKVAAAHWRARGRSARLRFDVGESLQARARSARPATRPIGRAVGAR